MDSGSTGATSPPEPTTVLGKYELGRLLGRGSFAKVYFARCLSDDGASVAIKIIDKSKLDPAMAPRIVREVIAMRRLNDHPNILRIHDVLATKSKIFIVMELARGGDLLSKLSSRPGRRFPERVARQYLHQIVSALQHCHRHGVAHRDVKPQNVLLDADGNLKVADFGLSAVAESSSDDLLKTACGTPAFTAPEVFERRGYDGSKADAWSCGVILFAFLARGLPFDDRNLVAMHRKMKSRDFQFPSHITRPAKALIYRLLDPNPKTRLSVEEITESPFFKATELGPQSMSMGDMVSNNEKKFERFSSMNAFDLIGMNPGLDLTGMFDVGERNKERRFTSRETPAAVAARVVEVGRKFGFEVEKGKGGNLWLGNGNLLMIVEVLEVTPEVLMVELKVVEGGGRGGISEQVQWGELRSELGDVVDFWHNERR